MPSRRCVVQGCNNVSNISAGISVHKSPIDRSLRAKWKAFVCTHRAHFNPDGRFAVCSDHFSPDSFERSVHVDGSVRRLKKGSFPTIWKKPGKTVVEEPLSKRGRRMAIRDILHENVASTSGQQEMNTIPEVDSSSSMQADYPQETLDTNADDLNTASEQELEPSHPPTPATLECFNLNEYRDETPMETREPVTGLPTTMPASSNDYVLPDLETSKQFVQLDDQCNSNTDGCGNCCNLQKEIESMKGEVKSLKLKATLLKNKMAKNQAQWVKTFEAMQHVEDTLTTPTHIETQAQLDKNTDEDQAKTVDEDIDDTEEDGDNEQMETEAPVFDEDPTWTPEEVDEAYVKLGDDCDDKKEIDSGLSFEGRNEREEPKGIVFLSKLLLLFQYCHLCMAPNPEVTSSQTGTLITIETKCNACKEIFTWKSQPFLLGKFPAGNLLLSFAVLCAGASIKKVLTVFQHMGVLVYNEPTYYYHQRHLLIPTVVSFWRKYQKKILDTLKGKEVVLAGDGRHDSMGHSAKYGTYTMFCCTVGLIIHVVLVQANQAGSSSAIEFMAFKEAFGYLLATGMIVKSFISDRHVSIAKWMREECEKKCKDLGKPVVKHFFDLWHIGKKIQKVLIKLSKEKNCEIIGRWRKACVRHFYWAVTSTEESLHSGKLKLAKFQSFLSHVINKHKNLPAGKMFKNCAHGNITKPKVWMSKASVAYEKLCTALNKSNLTKAIQQASSVEQTSCLEGYHLVVNQFAPKMLGFSYLGMLCRSILAALHFNYNLKRDVKLDEEGQPRLRVTFPKYKEGEGTVREARVPANFDYVAEIYETLVTTPRHELKLLEEELKQNVPEPLHSMLEKETKDEAIEKHKARKQKETVICGPTCTEAELQSLLERTQPATSAASAERRSCKCRKCGQPKRGHRVCPYDNNESEN